MNTRLQVEHPGHRDDDRHRHRRRQQIRVAQGEALTLDAGRHRLPRPRVRVPDQCRGPRHLRALPRARSPRWELPGGPGVRVDSHAGAGYRVPPYYDSLIAKLIVHGATREEALARLRAGAGRDAGRGHRHQPAAASADRRGRRLRRRRRRHPPSGTLAASGTALHDVAACLASACSARARCCSRRRARRRCRRSSASGRWRARRSIWPEVREAVPGMNNLMLSFAEPPRRSARIEAAACRRLDKRRAAAARRPRASSCRSSTAATAGRTWPTSSRTPA